MTRERTLRVRLVESFDTGICCVACGNFRKAAGGKFFAIVTANGSAPVAGMHSRCMIAAREAARSERVAKRAARKPVNAEVAPLKADGTWHEDGTGLLDEGWYASTAGGDRVGPFSTSAAAAEAGAAS